MDHFTNIDIYQRVHKRSRIPPSALDVIAAATKSYSSTVDESNIGGLQRVNIYSAVSVSDHNIFNFLKAKIIREE